MQTPPSRGTRVSSVGIGGSHHRDDDYGYDARRDAYDKFKRNPGMYSHHRGQDHGGIERHGGGYGGGGGGGYGGIGSRHHKGAVSVVIEHRSGCTGQTVANDIKESVKYNFPDVKVTEMSRGRYGSFEVFINGKILYSRIMQGGYPYEDEVLEAVDMARNGQEFEQLDRGSTACNIL